MRRAGCKIVVKKQKLLENGTYLCIIFYVLPTCMPGGKENCEGYDIS
jgi:hypothetical protein